MAETTPNLGLRVPRDLDTDSRFNLFRIDTLGQVAVLDASGNLLLRSPDDIFIVPEAAEVGGAGAGGKVTFGRSGHTLEEFNVGATTSIFSGTLQNTGSTSFGDLRARNAGGFHVGFAAPAAAASDLQFTLPATDGGAGQVLATDGATQLSWIDPAGGQSAGFTWAQVDGATKVITHSFGSKDVAITVYDQTDDSTVLVTSEVRSLNQVTLTAVAAPPPAGYRVLIREIT